MLILPQLDKRVSEGQTFDWTGNLMVCLAVVTSVPSRGPRRRNLPASFSHRHSIPHIASVKEIETRFREDG